MMKKLGLIFLCTLAIGISGCRQDNIFNAAEQAEIDDATIRAYLEGFSLLDDAIKDEESGIYIIIDIQGAGIRPSFGSSVITHYSGFLLSGEQFDSSFNRPGPLSFVLGRGEVIQGWERAFQLIEKGTSAVFLIPSGLAYGNVGTPTIPPNAVLQFDVNLIDVR